MISEWLGGVTVFWDRKRLGTCLLQPGNRGLCQINAFLNDDTLNICIRHLYSRLAYTYFYFLNTEQYFF